MSRVLVVTDAPPLPFQNPVSAPDLATIKYIAGYLPLFGPNCSGHLHYHLNNIQALGIVLLCLNQFLQYKIVLVQSSCIAK